MNFTIIGFGEVGSLVGALINGRFNNSTINIFDFPEEINGRILDFQHACICHNNIVYLNDKQKLFEADFLIYTAGYCNQVGESRYSVAQGNKELVKKIFSSQEINAKTKIIVVTNPVEPVSLWIHNILNETNLVIGTGTSLDKARLVSLIAAHFKCQISDISTLVVGEHGDWMIPLFSQTTIKGKPIELLASEKELQHLKHELKNAARYIRKTEKATKYGVAEICLQLIMKLIGQDVQNDCVSYLLPEKLKLEFGINKDLFVSCPVAISSKGVAVINFSMNEKEKNEFQAALQSISSAP